MLSFPGLTYLDVQKTGSTFVRAFLRSHAKGPVLADAKHRALGWEQWRPAFRFSSCRDPFRQYLSLYNYGSGDQGLFHRRIKERGGALAESYDGTAEGFAFWLRTVLDGQTMQQLYGKAKRYAPDRIGYQTTRFLHLNLRHSSKLALLLRNPADAAQAYRRFGLTRSEHVLRTESLSADLGRLVAGPLAPFLQDPAAALAELEAPKPINTSGGGLRLAPEALPEDLVALLQRKEAFLFEALGYHRYL